MEDTSIFSQSIPYVIVDATGRIIQFGTVNANMWALQGNGVDRIILPDDVPDGRYDEFYSPDGRSIVARPLFPAKLDRFEIRADGKDTARITGLPDPVTLQVDGNDVRITGGLLELTSTMAAEYRIAADLWPYMPFEAVVRAS